MTDIRRRSERSARGDGFLISDFELRIVELVYGAGVGAVA
jgi:hypothetical protein